EKESEMCGLLEYLKPRWPVRHHLQPPAGPPWTRLHVALACHVQSTSILGRGDRVSQIMSKENNHPDLNMTTYLFLRVGVAVSTLAFGRSTPWPGSLRTMQ